MIKNARAVFVLLLLVAWGCRDGSGLSDGGLGGFVDWDSDGIPDNIGSDGRPNGDTNNPYDTNGPLCGEADVDFEMQIPTVILLIDQSGSMDESFGGTDRWDAVYQTLFGDDGIVPRLESSVRFGMQLYTSRAGFEGGDCPLMTGVPAAMSNGDAMQSVFESNAPVEDTPTGDALVAVTDLLAADTEPGQKVIVLATDGEPDTCEVPNPQEGHAEAIAAAERAYDSGLSVYVISVGDDVGESHLSEMANAGQGYALDDPDGAEYYMGLSPDSLAAAFQDIIGGVRDCVLRIRGEVKDGLAGQCKVEADGVPLEYLSSDGWQLNTPSEIEIMGEACEQVLNGEISNLTVSCPCGSVVIV